jgi:uridylate kinase
MNQFGVDVTMAEASFPYKRVLVKLSGESLMEGQSFGINQKACQNMALAIKALRDSGVQVGIVIGGGNIFRGIHLEEMGLERTPADHMGMLATLINGIALQQALASISCPARVMSALECPKVVESFNWRRAQEYIQGGDTVIFVGGTGNPYFTTDTAAALRASEIQADIFLKATKVDGIYDKDPMKFHDAVKYDSLTYSQALAENLKVMDATSIALCRANKIPIFVFNMKYFSKDKIVSSLSKETLGTIVKGD